MRVISIYISSGVSILKTWNTSLYEMKTLAR